MRRNTRRAIGSALTFATVAASLIGLTSTSAFALDRVDCTSTDFAMVTVHSSGAADFNECFAGSGKATWGVNNWATKIWTGNNRVQWYGDGRWQPDQPIERYTFFTWPNHPGGVSISAIRFV